MNKEAIKEALGHAAYLSYHWQQYTFGQLSKEKRELCSLSKKALKELED